MDEEQRERDRLKEERYKAHLKRMKDLEDADNERANLRKVKENQDKIDDEKLKQ